MIRLIETKIWQNGIIEIILLREQGINWESAVGGNKVLTNVCPKKHSHYIHVAKSGYRLCRILCKGPGGEFVRGTESRFFCCPWDSRILLSVPRTNSPPAGPLHIRHTCSRYPDFATCTYVYVMCWKNCDCDVFLWILPSYVVRYSTKSYVVEQLDNFNAVVSDVGFYQSINDLT